MTPSEVPAGHVPIWHVRLRFRVDIGTKNKPSWVSSYLETTAAFLEGGHGELAGDHRMLVKCGRVYKRDPEHVRITAVEVLAYLSYTAWKTSTKTTTA